MRAADETKWLEIIPDKARDALINETLEEPGIRDLWEDVIVKGHGKVAVAEAAKKTQKRKADHDASPFAHADPTTGPPDGSPTQVPPDAPAPSGDSRNQQHEKPLEVALSKLCNAFRTSFRKLSGPHGHAGDGDDGWGTCCPNGQNPIRNPDRSDKEGNKPDIPFFAQRVPEGQITDWTNVIATIGVKPFDYQDLSIKSTDQLFRHARKHIQYHPICTRSHHVTVSGTRLRLWQFTPTFYASSRAYSFAKPADRPAIGRILALLTHAHSDSVVRQWVPPSMVEVTVPGKSKPETWEWTEGRCKVVHVRPEIWGSRTVIFGGPARLASSPDTDSTIAALSKRLERLDLDGTQSGDRITMVKCSLLPEHLLEHELQMQEHIAHLKGTPRPIGPLPLDIPAAEPPSHRRKAEPRRLHALAYQHGLGYEIPDEMSEKDLCKIFYELTDELRRYSDAGAHYRDLNTGNVLYQRKAKGQPPRLLLVDHGNMRLDGQRRGSREPGRVFDIAEEDARSANPMFLPSSMYYVENAIDVLTSGQDVEPDEDGDEEEEDLQEELAADVKSEANAQRDLSLYSHSHIDDLESACYVHVWYGHRRSFADGDAMRHEFHHQLTAGDEKRILWETNRHWRDFLVKFCPKMSKQWRTMMRTLRMRIYTAQTKRREQLEGDPDLLTKSAGNLYKFSSVEKECFKQCSDLYSRHYIQDKLDSNEFSLLPAKPDKTDEDTEDKTKKVTRAKGKKGEAGQAQKTDASEDDIDASESAPEVYPPPTPKRPRTGSILRYATSNGSDTSGKSVRFHPSSGSGGDSSRRSLRSRGNSGSGWSSRSGGGGSGSGAMEQ